MNKKEIILKLNKYEILDLMMSKSVTFLIKNKEYNIKVIVSKFARDKYERDMAELARLKR